MKTFLPKESDCLIFARSEGEALEVLSTILDSKYSGEGHFIYRYCALNKRGIELTKGRLKAGYILPHGKKGKTMKCDKSNFLHYDCDMYKPVYIEVDTRLSILDEVINKESN